MRTVTYEVPQLEYGINITSGFGTSTSLFFITAAFYFCMAILIVTIHNYFSNFLFSLYITMVNRPVCWSIVVRDKPTAGSPFSGVSF